MNTTSSGRITWTWLIALVVIAGAAGFLARLGLNNGPPDVQATLLNPPKPIGPFTLVDHRGQPFDQNRLRGGWTFLFFGYTHCPDVCPTTLGVLDRVDELLAGQSDRGAGVQTVFVTVDPERDTVETLARFVPFFNPGFIGVTGDTDEIERLTRDLGIMHLKSGTGAQGGYQVEHTGAILLVNPSGELVALFGIPHDARRIATDFLKIRAAAG